MSYENEFMSKDGKVFKGDVYTVLDAFAVNPVLVNAVKKLLCPGERGHKDEVKDLVEAIGCIEERIRLIKAWKAYSNEGF